MGLTGGVGIRYVGLGVGGLWLMRLGESSSHTSPPENAFRADCNAVVSPAKTGARWDIVYCETVGVGGCEEAGYGRGFDG
jgi:hypothetical protein